MIYWTNWVLPNFKSCDTQDRRQPAACRHPVCMTEPSTARLKVEQQIWRHFTKDTETRKQHMEIYKASLVIREMQLRTTRRYLSSRKMEKRELFSPLALLPRCLWTPTSLRPKAAPRHPPRSPRGCWDPSTSTASAHGRCSAKGCRRLKQRLNRLCCKPSPKTTNVETDLTECGQNVGCSTCCQQTENSTLLRTGILNEAKHVYTCKWPPQSPQTCLLQKNYTWSFTKYTPKQKSSNSFLAFSILKPEFSNLKKFFSLYVKHRRVHTHTHTPSKPAFTL